MESITKVSCGIGGLALAVGGAVAACWGGHNWLLYTGAGIALSGIALLVGGLSYQFFKIDQPSNDEFLRDSEKEPLVKQEETEEYMTEASDEGGEDEFEVRISFSDWDYYSSEEEEGEDEIEVRISDSDEDYSNGEGDVSTDDGSREHDDELEWYNVLENPYIQNGRYIDPALGIVIKLSSHD